MRRLLKLAARIAGCQLEPTHEEEWEEQKARDLELYPVRAWVIRLPGVFVGVGGKQERSSFETIVMAPTADYAWDVAMNTDAWTRLPFCIENAQIFPKDPEVISNGTDQAR